MARRRGPSVTKELLHQSREAALNAVQTFNNPLTTFKTETFIVLMSIAWTYLLHAYYHRDHIEYRYFSQRPKRRKFERMESGAFKYWDLAQCLKTASCPLDEPTRSNLRFLIGLRNEIVHHQSTGVDHQLASRYLACCLNYERYICDLFGEQHSLRDVAAFTLQFGDIMTGGGASEAPMRLPSNVAKYLREFDAEMSEEDFASPHFRLRFLFTPLVARSKAQADEVVEFVPVDSELGQEINRVFLKEVERPKHLPSEIVEQMREEGYPKFKMHQHIQLWKDLDAKNPGKGFGVQVTHTWFWYDLWVDKVREHCAANAELYRE